MPVGNQTDTLRSGARPCAPLDFGPTDPFGRLDCLLLPLLILSDMSTCDCAWSTRTDRRLSDRNDPLMGGDAPTKIWKVSKLSFDESKTRLGPGTGRAVLPRACGREHLGRGPSSTQPPFPRRAGSFGLAFLRGRIPSEPAGSTPASRTAEPLLRPPAPPKTFKPSMQLDP
jgi:hypothetical protein